MFRKRAAATSPLWRIVFLSACAIFVSACASTGRHDGADAAIDLDPPEPLHEWPYTRTEDGLVVVQGVLNEAAPTPFVIDTGASVTTITRATAEALGIWRPDAEKVMVHGFFESAEHPVARLDRIAVGALSRDDMEVVVLETPKTGAGTVRNLLGLDFFAGHVMEIQAEPPVVKLYDRSDLALTSRRDWAEVALRSDPFERADLGLLFFDVRLNGREVPAVLDTGASFTAANWTTYKDWRLRTIRRRLEDDWRAQGAVGEFQPRATAIFERLTIGDRLWAPAEVVLVDLNMLRALERPDAELVIAGLDLFGGRDMLIDPLAGRFYVTGPRRRAPSCLFPHIALAAQPTRLKADKDAARCIRARGD